MNFRGSFCHPLHKKVIDLGDIPVNKIIETFQKTDWKNYLEMCEADPDHVEYSPSLEIENKDNKNGITLSAVGDPNNFEFYIFYQRPKEVKRFFGLSKSIDEKYMTDITGQNEQDALSCLNALIAGNLDFLEEKIK